MKTTSPVDNNNIAKPVETKSSCVTSESTSITPRASSFVTNSTVISPWFPLFPHAIIVQLNAYIPSKGAENVPVNLLKALPSFVSIVSYFKV